MRKALGWFLLLLPVAGVLTVMVYSVGWLVLIVTLLLFCVVIVLTFAGCHLICS